MAFVFTYTHTHTYPKYTHDIWNFNGHNSIPFMNQHDINVNEIDFN